MTKKYFPDNLSPVNKTPRALRRYGLKMGYTGLMHYRTNNLVDAPIKIEGFKERFYDVEKLAKRINSVSLITGLFDISFEKIADLSKLLPEDIFNQLPYYYMQLYSDINLNPTKIGLNQGEVDRLAKYSVKSFGRIYLQLVKIEAKEHKVSREAVFFRNVRSKYLEILKGLDSSDPVEESMFFNG